MNTSFSTGNKELDTLIGPIHSGYMLLIVGHPGSGKTTLASSVCYENALKGCKCLYISFYEDKDKLYRNMVKLGIDLASAESKGLMTHVKLPVTEPQEVLNTINELVVKDSYRVVVIDSINPVIELYRKKEQRAILLNFFYNLINVIDGLLVTIAEIPWGKETLNLGAVEFVADAIIYLKHRIARGLLTRILELRKVRGAPLSTVEIPFDVVEGKGIVVYAPRRPERPLSTMAEKLKTCLLLEEAVGPIHRGDVAVASYPPNKRPAFIVAPFINIAVDNDMKILGISYRYSEADAKASIESALTKYLGLSPREAEWVTEKYVHIESTNPASMSIPQLVNLEMRLIEKEKPDMVIFHACEIPWRLTRNTDEDGYWSSLVNQLTWLENQGIVTVRLFSRVDPHFVKMSEALADISIRVYYKPGNGEFKPVWYTWRRSQEPKILDFASAELQEKIRECAKILKETIQEKKRLNIPQ